MTLAAFALLALLAAPLSPVSSQDPPQDPEREQEAEALFERALSQVEDEHYADAQRTYRKLAEQYADTAAGLRAADRARPSAFLGWKTLVSSGRPSNRVDLVLMGDGYVLKHQDQFDDFAEDLPPRFERQRTYGEYFGYLNFHRANLVSADNGVDGFGREYDTALGARTLPTFAGHVGVDAGAVARTLAQIPPSDGQAIVFVKNGVLGTGGGGTATIGGLSERITLHEFGHAFVGLSDEYATKTHERSPPRDGINVSAVEDPARVPWAHWIEARVPGIGVYEGASGQVRGAWKPTASGCLMNDGEFLCRVCREATVLRIYSLVDPIDACRPPAPDTPTGLYLVDRPLEFEVTVLQPSSHELEVGWWIFHEDDVPRAAPTTVGDDPTPGSTGSTTTSRSRPRSTFRDRRARGPLVGIESKPTSTTRPDADGVHRLRIRASELEPGRWRLICRVRDRTQWRGERYPWVLKDEHGLLESERAWWIVVPER